jgi:hypothetical protein
MSQDGKSLLLCVAILLISGAISAHAQQPADERDVRLKKLAPNILEDQKAIWSFPARLAQRKDVWATAAFAVTGTALVVGADPPAARYFRNTTAFDGFNRGMPSLGTNADPRRSRRSVWRRADTEGFEDDEGRAA